MSSRDRYLNKRNPYGKYLVLRYNLLKSEHRETGRHFGPRNQAVAQEESQVGQGSVEKQRGRGHDLGSGGRHGSALFPIICYSI